MSRKHHQRTRLNMAATLPAPAPQRKSLNVYASGVAYDAAMPTGSELHKMFGPVKTLGLPVTEADAMYLAMDNALEHSGFYSLIQHAFSLGQPPQGNGFIGYAALSDLKQNGLISACIETVVDDMLREWIEIERAGGKVDEDSDGQDDVIPDIEAAAKELKLRHAFRETAALTQYFGGGLIFIDTGVTDPEALKKPLDISDKSGELGMGKLRGFTAIEPINIFPGNYNSLDPLRRDYFEPRSWWVLGREVHASRFIKISSGDVPVLLRPSYNFFGVPHAQILWDYVLHFQKDRVATSRMLSKYSDFIFKIGGLQDAMTMPSGTAELERRLGVMSRYRSNDGIAAIDKDNEDVVKVESSLAGLVDITRQDLGFLCAINRTPAEKLLGEPPPGFNSTGASSIRNYYDHIASQQEKVLYDGVAKALACIQLHVTGRIDSSISFHFKELGGEDRQLESGIRKANTDTLAALVMSEIITPDGARSAIEANPDEYLAGLTDGIKADREAMEAAAEGELDGLEAGEFGEPVPGQEPPRKEEILEVQA